jgi:hypothetical protein
MHFPHLTEMGHQYAAEEGTEGVRRETLERFAPQLRELRVSLTAERPGRNGRSPPA